MLTIKEIDEVQFSRVKMRGREFGYTIEEVDDFIDDVLVTIQGLAQKKEGADAKAEEMESKNIEMQKKLSILAEKIESYRDDEDGIKEAVLSAHKMSKSAIREAKQEAALILSDAQKQADNILAESQAEADAILSGARDESARKAKLYAEQVVLKRNELEQIKRQITAFRSSLMEMYKKHIELINHMPSFKLKEDEKPKAEIVPEIPKDNELSKEDSPVQEELFKRPEATEVYEEISRTEDME